MNDLAVLKVETQGAARVLTVDRPSSRNAINRAVAQRLVQYELARLELQPALDLALGGTQRVRRERHRAVAHAHREAAAVVGRRAAR